MTQQAGVHHVRNTAVADLLLLWNNRQNEAFRYQFNEYDSHRFEIEKRFVLQADVVPTFTWFAPEKGWQLTVDYAGVTAVELSRL